MTSVSDYLRIRVWPGLSASNKTNVNLFNDALDTALAQGRFLGFVGLKFGRDAYQHGDQTYWGSESARRAQACDYSDYLTGPIEGGPFGEES